MPPCIPRSNAPSTLDMPPLQSTIRNQFKLQRERAEALANVVKQAIDDYLPRDKRDLMHP